MTDKGILSSPVKSPSGSTKSPAQSTGKKTIKPTDNKENLAALPKGQTTLDKRRKSGKSPELKNQKPDTSKSPNKGVLDEIQQDEALDNEAAFEEPQRFPIRIPVKKMAKKKDYLASDRSSHQRKISSARVSKESSNSKDKKQKDKKKMKNSFSKGNTEEANKPVSRPVTAQLPLKASSTGFSQDPALADKIQGIAELIDNIVEQKLHKYGVDKVNPKMLVNQVKAQVANMLGKERVTSPPNRGSVVSTSKSFHIPRGAGGVSSPSWKDQKSFRSNRSIGRDTKAGNRSTKSLSRAEKNRANQSVMTEPPQRVRTKEEIMENTKRIVIENLKKFKELKLKQKEEEEKERQQSEARKKKLEKLLGKIKKNSQKYRSESPKKKELIKHKYGWGVDQTKLEKRPEPSKKEVKEKIDEEARRKRVGVEFLGKLEQTKVKKIVEATKEKINQGVKEEDEKYKTLEEKEKQKKHSTNPEEQQKIKEFIQQQRAERKREYQIEKERKLKQKTEKQERIKEYIKSLKEKGVLNEPAPQPKVEEKPKKKKTKQKPKNDEEDEYQIDPTTDPRHQRCAEKLFNTLKNVLMKNALGTLQASASKKRKQEEDDDYYDEDFDKEEDVEEELEEEIEEEVPQRGRSQEKNKAFAQAPQEKVSREKPKGQPIKAKTQEISQERKKEFAPTVVDYGRGESAHSRGQSGERNVKDLKTPEKSATLQQQPPQKAVTSSTKREVSDLINKQKANYAKKSRENSIGNRFDEMVDEFQQQDVYENEIMKGKAFERKFLQDIGEPDEPPKERGGRRRMSSNATDKPSKRKVDKNEIKKIFGDPDDIIFKLTSDQLFKYSYLPVIQSAEENMRETR